jgi:hypothetical protein
VARKSDGFARKVGIGIETVFPNTVAENDDGSVLLVSAKASTEGHRELSDVEEIGGGGLAPEALGITFAGDGGGEKFIESSDAGEGAGVVAKIREEGPGEGIAAFVAVGGVEGQESRRIANGRGMENEAGNQGEDGGVGADTESEGEDGNQGEGGFVSEEARGKTKISEEGFESGEGVLVADGFFDLLEAAEFK